jgi:acetoacetyl-CoA synthetase
MSIVARPIEFDDFEEVYRLLLSFNNSRINKSDWARLFSNPWETEGGTLGFKLVDLEINEIIGYQGIISSKRIIENVGYTFYNLSSWIVKPEYRRYSQMLQEAIFNLEKGILVTFTPSPQAFLVRKRLGGFKEIDQSTWKIWPSLRNLVFIQLITDVNDIYSYVDFSTKKIIDDHKNYSCSFFLLKTESENCFGVLKHNHVPNISRRYLIRPSNIMLKLPTADIHYLSNPKLFVSYMQNCNLNFFWSFKIFFLFIDQRFFKGVNLKYFKKIPILKPKLFKGDIDPILIDTLYSELFVLNH